MKFLRLAICGALVCGLLAWAARSSTHDDVNVLKGKVVFLRGMEAGERLSFDTQGKASENYAQVPFSLSALKVEKVHLSDTKLEIRGYRVVLVFQTESDSPTLKDIRFIPTREQVEITVARDEAHPESLDAAILKIFAPSPPDALAGMSPNDEAQALDSLGSTAPPSKETPSIMPVAVKEGAVYKPGRNGVSPPRLTYSVDPEFTQEAKKKKLSGICVLSLIVDSSGHPMRIRIVRSADPGLDMNAIAAVSQYRFEPALLNGKPVAVYINVEVNFRIY